VGCLGGVLGGAGVVAEPGVECPGSVPGGVGVVGEPAVGWPGGVLGGAGVMADAPVDGAVAASAVNARAASSGSRRRALAKHQLGDRA